MITTAPPPPRYARSSGRQGLPRWSVPTLSPFLPTIVAAAAAAAAMPVCKYTRQDLDYTRVRKAPQMVVWQRAPPGSLYTAHGLHSPHSTGWAADGLRCLGGDIDCPTRSFVATSAFFRVLAFAGAAISSAWSARQNHSSLSAPSPNSPGPSHSLGRCRCRLISLFLLGA